MPHTPSQIRVHFLPQFAAEHQLAGSAVVVVDLLRASTTICHALAAGAKEVIPFAEIDETWQAATQLPRSEFVLGGERGGRKITGFDLGNSPAEYTPSVVFGKKILFTTTNGTRALQHARLAARVYIGALVNLSSVVRRLRTQPRVDILCAGTGGHVTREDILAAGAIVRGLCFRRDDPLELNDEAERARSEWEELLTAARIHGVPLASEVAAELRHTPGGKNLLVIGCDEDLVTCAQVDELDLLPELELERWRIHLR